MSESLPRIFYFLSICRTFILFRYIFHILVSYSTRLRRKYSSKTTDRLPRIPQEYMIFHGEIQIRYFASSLWVIREQLNGGREEQQGIKWLMSVAFFMLWSC